MTVCIDAHIILVWFAKCFVCAIYIITEMISVNCRNGGSTGSGCIFRRHWNYSQINHFFVSWLRFNSIQFKLNSISILLILWIFAIVLRIHSLTLNCTKVYVTSVLVLINKINFCSANDAIFNFPFCIRFKSITFHLTALIRSLNFQYPALNHVRLICCIRCLSFLRWTFLFAHITHLDEHGTC